MALRTRLRPVVLAVLETVLQGDLERQQPADAAFDRVVDEMMVKLLEMPRYLGAGMIMLTFTFDGASVATDGRRFRDLDLPRRTALLGRWRDAPVPLLPTFVEFYERMGAFVFYSELGRAP